MATAACGSKACRRLDQSTRFGRVRLVCPHLVCQDLFLILVLLHIKNVSLSACVLDLDDDISQRQRQDELERSLVRVRIKVHRLCREGMQSIDERGFLLLEILEARVFRAQLAQRVRRASGVADLKHARETLLVSQRHRASIVERLLLQNELRQVNARQLCQQTLRLSLTLGVALCEILVR